MDAHAHPDKKQKVENGAYASSKKNIVEIHGKSCMHEVAWPPGASCLYLLLLLCIVTCLSLSLVVSPMRGGQKQQGSTIVSDMGRCVLKRDHDTNYSYLPGTV